MSDTCSLNAFTVELAHELRNIASSNSGSLPGEQELMARLSVGRSTLRESLAALEAIGAVESRRGARRRWLGLDLGALIVSASELAGDPLADTRELLEIRRAIETSMLARVMPLHSRSSYQELREISAAMVELASRGQSFVDLDQHFHLSLFRPLKNTILEGILSAFWALLRKVDRQEDIDVARDVEVAAMHGEIIDALDTGDYELGRHALDTHFYGVRKRIVPPRRPPFSQD